MYNMSKFTQQEPEKDILIIDVFENALNSLPSLTGIQASIIAKNITELNYLDKLIAKKNSRKVYERLAKQMSNQILSRTVIVDIMSLSALYYKGKKAGFNVEPLRKAMLKNSSWLMDRQNILMQNF